MREQGEQGIPLVRRAGRQQVEHEFAGDEPWFRRQGQCVLLEPLPGDVDVTRMPIVERQRVRLVLDDDAGRR